jgi:hypothetical protein
MTRISNAQKVLNEFGKCDRGVQNYFWMLSDLLLKVSKPGPALAYCFQQIEAGHRVTLYALLLRKYRTKSDLSWKAVDRLDITRKNFPEFYKKLAGKSFDQNLRDMIGPAEKVRDRIIHGKEVSDVDVLAAITVCLRYAEAVNKDCKAVAGFAPFGDLRGVTSSKVPKLDPDISRLVIKGLGLENAKGDKMSEETFD